MLLYFTYTTLYKGLYRIEHLERDIRTSPSSYAYGRMDPYETYSACFKYGSIECERLFYRLTNNLLYSTKESFLWENLLQEENYEDYKYK